MSNTTENRANCNHPLADMSEFLREQQRGAEVDEQQDREQQSDDCNEVHGLPQLLTGLDVKKGHGEENGCEEEHGQILHIAILDSERHAEIQAARHSNIDSAGRGILLAEGKSKEKIRTRPERVRTISSEERRGSTLLFRRSLLEQTDSQPRALFE